MEPADQARVGAPVIERGATDGHVQAEARFSCDALSEEHRVLALTIAEELGRPYRVEAKVLLPVEQSVDFYELLGRSASVLVDYSGQARKWAGIVAEVRGADDDLSNAVITVTLVPALAVGAWNQNSRIFQDVSPVAIIQRVLAEILDPRERTFDASLLDEARYVTRTYCTQYKESSLDFVHRLMEEEGIGYFFRTEVDEAAETLVLFDRQSSLQPIANPESGILTYRVTPGDTYRENVVQSFDTRIAPVAISLALRDYDWARAQHTRAATVETGEAGPEIYEHGFGDFATIHEQESILHGLATAAQAAAIPFGWPAGALGLIPSLLGTVVGDFTEDDAPAKARVRAELMRRDLLVGTGTSTALALTPGTTFELVGHPGLLRDSRYLVTKVAHEVGGSDEGRLLNSFECIPVAVTWRPSRRTRRPRIYSVQTATVTGPEGIEIHTDPYGRIQVRFHWYRPDSGVTPTSCWIRCAQTWAGPGHPGFSFIPRVGMEVLVSFMDGDPDRPLVMGCVHNVSNPQPTALPIQATKSVIRTRTVPFGEGYNEISFEDARGLERLHLRAERDLDELVQRDRTAVINRDERSVIKRDRSTKVARNVDEAIGGNRTLHVAKSESVDIGEDAKRTVQGMEANVVVGSQETVVHGASHQLHVPNGFHTVEARRGIVVRQHENTISMFSSESDPEGEEGPRGVEVRSPDEVRLTAGGTAITMNGVEEGVIALSNRDAYIRLGNDKVEVRLGRSVIEVTPDMIRINKKVFPA